MLATNKNVKRKNQSIKLLIFLFYVFTHYLEIPS